MITTIRSVQTLPGKAFEAIAWGKEIVSIVKRVTGRDLSVSLAFGGKVAEIAWIGQYDSASQIEEGFAKLFADREYVSAVKKAENFVVPGTAQDHYWRSV